MKQLDQAVSTMRYNNLYHYVTWGFSATNGYEFDQDKGIVTYAPDNENLTIDAVPEVMGTYNLDDKTFLWGDKNKYVDEKLTSKLAAFRNQLPGAYTSDKFKTDVNFVEKLLALFSLQLNANGYDYRRQDNTIIFYALLKIEVYDKEELIKTLMPKPHAETISNDALIETIKRYHKEKMDINQQVYTSKKISQDDAFNAMEAIQQKYWITMNYDVSLCDRCAYDEQYTSNWAVIKFKDTNRVFVIYSSNYMQFSVNHLAYEVAAAGEGEKVILGSY
ncbi:MAG: hypothetical protein MUE99_09125 [Chitinophagaceae bacterium]|nr:hypothetical protein [Chitinophagaceae bacterium]